MSGTKRIPIARPPSLQVSPRAIELFEALGRTRKQRNAVDCIPDDGSGYCSTKCKGCRDWYDLHAALHDELGLKPWQWLALPRNPYPPGSPQARRWRAHSDSEQSVRWRLLDAASRASATRCRSGQ
jgi:hypothetical protein